MSVSNSSWIHCLRLQAAVCVPVVLWLFLVRPISLRTMHDDDEEEHTGSIIPVKWSDGHGWPHDPCRMNDLMNECMDE